VIHASALLGARRFFVLQENERRTPGLKGALSDSVSIRGFDWCKDKPKTIGINSLTANVLCRDHNSALSDLDAPRSGYGARSGIRRPARGKRHGRSSPHPNSASETYARARRRSPARTMGL